MTISKKKTTKAINADIFKKQLRQMRWACKNEREKNKTLNKKCDLKLK